MGGTRKWGTTNRTAQSGPELAIVKHRKTDCLAAAVVWTLVLASGCARNNTRNRPPTPVPGTWMTVAGLGSPYDYVDRIHHLGELDADYHELPLVVRDGMIGSRYFGASFLSFHGDSLVRIELATSKDFRPRELDSVIHEFAKLYPLRPESAIAQMDSVEHDTALRFMKRIPGDSIVATLYIERNECDNCVGFGLFVRITLASLENFIDSCERLP